MTWNRELLRARIAELTAERDECRRTAIELGTHADAVADTRVNHEMSGLRADLARAQQRIMELEGRIARQEEWLRWPNHNMHEPVAKLYAEHFPNGGLRQTKDRFHAAIDRLNMVVLEQLALANKHLGQLREWLEPTPSTTDHHGCSDERCRQCYGEP